MFIVAELLFSVTELLFIVGWRDGRNPSLSLVILYRFVADWYCHLGFSPVFLWSFFPLLLFQKFGHFEFCPQADILGLIF
jgi:hypothetical protein